MVDHGREGQVVVLQDGQSVLRLFLLQVEHLAQLLELLQLTERLQDHQHGDQTQQEVDWRENDGGGGRGEGRKERRRRGGGGRDRQQHRIKEQEREIERETEGRKRMAERHRDGVGGREKKCG